ncbi:nuclear pore glycoprotein p62 [Moniliophthora roreri MCA 2997]|uniref:Nucleoporin NSP1 n=1 Tax=Moniliophthora roreri (strain MCA 2997) TaxID=1381753 RepID=V2XXF3_MONRO|nr:nuclear pore glycoprotein p62 [Moniliophthora roreri MCA 2997]
MSLFGNPGGTNPSGSGSGLFGANNSANSTGGSIGSIFGNTAGTTSGGLFGGGSNTNTSTAPASGGLFGGASTINNTTTTGGTSTPSAAPSNSLFGGSSAFSLPKPGDQAAKDAPKPASSFFSNPSATTPSSSMTPAPSLFGATPKPAEGATAAGTTPANSTTANSAFGGLFGKPAVSTGTTTTAATPAAASSSTSPFSLNKDSSTTAPAAPSGGLFAAKPTEKKDDKPATSTAPLGSLFGAPKPDEKKDGATALSGGISLGAKTETKEGDKAALTTTTTAPVVAVPPPSMLRGKTIEEIVNKWSTELETHVKEFNKFAAEVSMWDRALIENGNNLAALYGHVLAAEREQNEVDQSLNHIEQQQKDLAATLDSYEKVAEEIFGGGQGGGLRALDTGPADTERDKNYMLATDLHTHLDDLSNSLTQMIESVNGLSLPSGSDTPSEDPMTQISQILSTHLESLQWIDGAVREVEGKVTEVEKRVKESGHAPSLGGNSLKSRSFGR